MWRRLCSTGNVITGPQDTEPKKCSTPRHLIVKLANSKDKDLKAVRDKKSLNIMERSIRITADFST